MTGGRMYGSSDTPQRHDELTSKAYVEASIAAGQQFYDSRHQALSNNHSSTRLALQQLIQSVHGDATTLSDGANSFSLVASEWEQYKATTDGIQTVMASKTDLEYYVKSADLDAATVDSARSADRLRNVCQTNL